MKNLFLGWLGIIARYKSDRDLVMTHVAAEYDRTGWQQDLNTIIPFDRLEEMANDGEIALCHYAFMGLLILRI